MIRLNVGISRKVGQSNFGSKGGSVNLEIELPDLDNNKLRESIQRLFSLAKQSLEDELGSEGQQAQDKPVVQVSVRPEKQTLQEAITAQAKQATAKQLGFLQNLARTQRRNLEQECEQAYHTLPERLTSKQASTLIERWRNAPVSAR